jgi:hypothetical protein
LCLLVMIGVRADGRKELIALSDGYRESTGSSADLLRDCKRRGTRAPVLAAGDGARGFWGALREVFPETQSNVAGSIKFIACGRAGDGVQAHRVSTGPLACGERTALVALVRAGARFVNGELVERPGEHAPSTAA